MNARDAHDDNQPVIDWRAVAAKLRARRWLRERDAGALETFLPLAWEQAQMIPALSDMDDDEAIGWALVVSRGQLEMDDRVRGELVFGLLTRLSQRLEENLREVEAMKALLLGAAQCIDRAVTEEQAREEAGG